MKVNPVPQQQETLNIAKTKNQFMTITDVNILSKKILVGFVLFLVPLVIIGGGLLLIKILLTK